MQKQTIIISIFLLLSASLLFAVISLNPTQATQLESYLKARLNTQSVSYKNIDTVYSAKSNHTIYMITLDNKSYRVITQNDKLNTIVKTAEMISDE